MRPLSGLKVLDFSTLLPGPYASMLLADMGAEVLRIESPSRVDLVREMPPTPAGQSVAFHYLNRGKRSLALNLKAQASLQIIHQLLAEYDVVIEQFRPGVMQRLGLGYEALKAINPRLIYCSITGYGQTGEYRDRAGHDINYLSISGIADSSGRKEAGPLLAGVQIADVAAGSQPAALSILAAVIQRNTTGEGQHIDIAMSDHCMALQPLMMSNVLAGQAPIHAEDHFLNGSGIYDYYRTADDRYMGVGSLEPQFKKVLLEVLAIDESQCDSESELKALIAQAFLAEPQSFWRAKFAPCDACVEPVLDMREALDHPHHQSRQMVTTTASGMQQIRPVPHMAGTEYETLADAPLCGQHNDEVLASLGYTELQVIELKGMGVFS
jgi:crotonobetainyl-CoA:carnitine CoA-transferase CaiB-like acyl-CoA transferase